jgi:methionyl-tRNA formyltransferase
LEDAELLFAWANDAVTRQQAFNSAAIPWDSHSEWLRARLADPDRTAILIGEVDGIPVGQIRFDRSGSRAEIDYSVEEGRRGRGIGARLLASGTRRARSLWPDLDQVVGVVKPGNTPSVRSFQRAGFREDSSTAASRTFVWRPEQLAYVVAAPQPWFGGMVEELRKRVPGSFEWIREPGQLTRARLDALRPDYVFFPHWSWIIPQEIHESFDCVVFHMTDLPFGRGGTPLQNLIARGIYDTKVSAIFADAGLDTGDVLLKRPLSLHGAAEEIYLRASYVIRDMIKDIIRDDPDGEPQSGEPTHFKRRTPEQSTIVGIDSLDGLFDHIRMLDAPGYPHACLEVGGFVMRFTRAARRDGAIVTDCTITAKEDA